MASSPPKFVTGLKCLVCGNSYQYGNMMTCPSCGIQGILNVQYDYDALAGYFNRESLNRRPLDHWRYRELLPISPEIPLPNLQVGSTPVYETSRLARAIGIGQLFLKDEGRNPTSSLKDRASSVGVLKAIEFGYSTIACASTGNAASSLAGLSAATNLKSFIFVPEWAPEPKVTQLLIFGATVLKVKGTYEQAFDLCREACTEFNWYNRNSGTNPFLVEGKKTAGLEIVDQCKDHLPDWVVVPVGDGCTIGGIGKGMQEMNRLGFAGRIPRLLGVQAEGARPIADAFGSGKELVPSETHTIADGIAVGTPRNWRRAVEQIKSSNGGMVTVTDEEILEAMRMTARLASVFGEPAGVASVAGLKKATAKGIIKPTETALVVITGNGLKDISSAKRAAGEALSIKPNIDALAQAIPALSMLRVTSQS